MTGTGAGDAGTGGGPARHVPVLLHEVLEALAIKPGGLYLDGTFGAGGYTRGILNAGPTRVIALDRDPNAIRDGQVLLEEAGGRLRLVETAFSEMEEAAAGEKLDGIVLDIGVSSMQLDEAHRGFSFRFDGPLDMRMADEGETAADLVNYESEERLADIFYYFGEERLSRVVARAIVAERKENRFTSTKQLADFLKKMIKHRPGDIHPATRSFQALRIAVNDELGELARALHAAERILKPEGRLVVVSFHSLEDRIAKVFFASRSGRGGGSRYAPVAASGVPTFRIEGKFPVVAGEGELHANPRSRSAKLRAAIRLDTPPQGMEAAVMDLASLPEPKRNKGATKPGAKTSAGGKRR